MMASDPDEVQAGPPLARPGLSADRREIMRLMCMLGLLACLCLLGAAGCDPGDEDYCDGNVA